MSAFLAVKSNYYRIYFWDMNKKEAARRMKNSDYSKERRKYDKGKNEIIYLILLMTNIKFSEESVIKK